MIAIKIIILIFKLISKLPPLLSSAINPIKTN